MEVTVTITRGGKRRRTTIYLSEAAMTLVTQARASRVLAGMTALECELSTIVSECVVQQLGVPKPAAPTRRKSKRSA